MKAKVFFVVLLYFNTLNAQVVINNDSLSCFFKIEEGLLFIKNKGTMPNYSLENNDYYNRGYWPKYENDIKRIIIDEGVSSIGDRAFMYCPYIDSVSISSTVTKIGIESFSGCYRINHLFIPPSVTTIGSSAFSNCNGLSNIILGDSIKYIGAFAFMETGIVSIKIPQAVKIIQNGLFLNCYKLKSVTLHDSLFSIGSLAFYGCHELETIDIPKSVEKIGSCAFSQCNKLKKIKLHYLDFCLVKIDKDAFKNTDTSKITLCVPKGSIHSYHNLFNRYLGGQFLYEEYD